MSYDSICFQDKCRLDHKQLFYSQSHDCQIHFDERHPVQVMHPGTPFFRSLKTEPIKFNDSLRKVCSRLKKQYLRSVQRVKSFLTANFQQSQRRLKDIYEFNHKIITLDSVKPYLSRMASQTELCLALVNWKKDHPTEDIKNYIQHMPETCIKDYTAKTDSLIESLSSILPKYSGTYSIGDMKSYDSCDYQDGNSRIIQCISKQVSVIYERSIKLEDSSFLSFQRKPTIQKQGILMQLAEVFCNSQSQLKYRDLEQPLLSKILTNRRYNSQLLSLMNKIYSHIEEYMYKEFGIRKLKSRQRQPLLSNLRKYRCWMDKEQADLFVRCVQSFMGHNKDIVINPSEVYIIYMLIVIRMIEKKGNKSWSLNVSPVNLKKEIIYLYAYFDDFDKVKEMLLRRYSSAQELTDESFLKNKLKEIVIDTYNLLTDRESLQHARFQQLINEETEFYRQNWRQIMRKYISYQLQRKLDNADKLWLEDAMEAIVPRQPSEKDTEEGEASQLTSAMLSMTNKSSGRNQTLWCQSMVKREQISECNDNSALSFWYEQQFKLDSSY